MKRALALLVVLLLVGCDQVTYRAASFAANEAAAVGWGAQPVLEQRCMVPMRAAAAAHDGPAADRIKARCGRILAAHEGLRMLHVALVAALRAEEEPDFLALAKQIGKAALEFSAALKELESS